MRNTLHLWLWRRSFAVTLYSQASWMSVHMYGVQVKYTPNLQIGPIYYSELSRLEEWNWSEVKWRSRCNSQEQSQDTVFGFVIINHANPRILNVFMKFRLPSFSSNFGKIQRNCITSKWVAPSERATFPERIILAFISWEHL